MANGSVKRFSDSKGFGFISAEGDKVSFDIEKRPKGPNPVNVVKL